jgi:hypothetical protein
MRYLVINFLRKTNGRIDEIVSVAKDLNIRDKENANIIADFGTKTIVKSVIENKQHDADFDKLREYYLKIYPNLIGQLDREAPIDMAEKKKKK